jgi:hypothetical protein
VAAWPENSRTLQFGHASFNPKRKLDAGHLRHQRAFRDRFHEPFSSLELRVGDTIVSSLSLSRVSTICGSWENREKLLTPAERSDWRILQATRLFLSA